jgi:hypothetical protein
MLSTFTVPSRPARRRGGQLGNNNARKHGFYASRRPHPAVRRLAHLRSLESSVRLAFQQADLPLLQQHVSSLHELMAKSFSSLSLKDTSSRTLLQVDRFLNIARASLYARTALKRLLDERDFIPRLARNALPLCTSEFTDRWIHPYPLFVPPLLRKNRALLHRQPAGSRPETSPLPLSRHPSSVFSRPPSVPARFLTDHQWSLLAPLLSSLREHMASLNSRRRLRPYDDRLLLDAILVKLAFDLPWPELQSFAPVRACQLLYKHLFLSGCMFTIYQFLGAHLETFGSASLQELVADGHFSHEGSHIALSDPETTAWEHRTALLLLQRASFNRRRRQRLKDLKRRRHGHYLRMPSLCHPRRHPARRASKVHPPATPPSPLDGSQLIPLSAALSTSPPLAEKLDFYKEPGLSPG